MWMTPIAVPGDHESVLRQGENGVRRQIFKVGSEGDRRAVADISSA